MLIPNFPEFASARPALASDITPKVAPGVSNFPDLLGASMPGAANESSELPVAETEVVEGGPFLAKLPGAFDMGLSGKAVPASGITVPQMKKNENEQIAALLLDSQMLDAEKPFKLRVNLPSSAARTPDTTEEISGSIETDTIKSGLMDQPAKVDVSQPMSIVEAGSFLADSDTTRPSGPEGDQVLARSGGESEGRAKPSPVEAKGPLDRTDQPQIRDPETPTFAQRSVVTRDGSRSADQTGPLGPKAPFESGTSEHFETVRADQLTQLPTQPLESLVRTDIRTPMRLGSGLEAQSFETNASASRAAIAAPSTQSDANLPGRTSTTSLTQDAPSIDTETVRSHDISKEQRTTSDKAPDTQSLPVSQNPAVSVEQTAGPSAGASAANTSATSIQASSVQTSASNAAVSEARTDLRAPAQLESAIEQFTETREAARSNRPELTLRHQEFGAVNVRLEALGNDLRATLSARDPGFVPAIQTALADRAVAASNEASFGQSPRGNEQGGTNTGSSSGSAGQGWNSDARYGSSTGSGQGGSQPYSEHIETHDEDAAKRAHAEAGDREAGSAGEADLFA